MEDDTKQCPYCAETIKRAAKVCRYCHMELTTGKPARAIQAAPEPVRTSEVRARSGVWDGVKIGVGIFIVLPLLLLVVCSWVRSSSGLRHGTRLAIRCRTRVYFTERLNRALDLTSMQCGNSTERLRSFLVARLALREDLNFDDRSRRDKRSARRPDPHRARRML
jgi:hypothetical protein